MECFKSASVTLTTVVNRIDGAADAQLPHKLQKAGEE